MDIARARAEYASLVGLSPQELCLLTEVISYIEPHPEEHGPPSQDPHTQLCYKLRYEAAEARYARMKAVVCALLEMLRTGRQEQVAADPSPSTDELVRLREINRCLRNGIKMELPPWEAPSPNEADVVALRAQLVVAHKQITAMDLELARLNDKKFEEDERAREYEDVFRSLLRAEERPDPGPVHPRFHPISVCQDAGCRNYARRLRNGLRQAVAEAYVRDRNVRIHGHFRRVVEPVERLRAEKDAELARLRRRVRQLECAAFTTAEEAEATSSVSRELVDALARLDDARREGERLRAECVRLQSRRDGLQVSVTELLAELQDANRTIDSVAERRALCQAELDTLARERESVQQIWDRIDRFMSGAMARDYEHKRLELERLEREMAALHERMDELGMEDDGGGACKRVRA